jgi:chromosome segregation ATPase
MSNQEKNNRSIRRKMNQLNSKISKLELEKRSLKKQLQFSKEKLKKSEPRRKLYI